MGMTDDELKAIKARAEAATAGPWAYNDHESDDRWEPIMAPSGALFSGEQFREEDDGRFIAHARTDVPALIEEIERLMYALASCEHARDLNQARARQAEALVTEVVPQLEWLMSERDTYDLQENGIPSLLERLKAL